MEKTGNFFTQVKTELSKVVWPSKDELITSTIVVLVSLVILGIYVGICDLFFSRIIHFIISGVF